MEKEIHVLHKNDTWHLVPPQQVNVIDSKWVFKVKKKSDGSIERYKTRLVARSSSINMELTMRTRSVL
jgi:hypothetical protein